MKFKKFIQTEDIEPTEVTIDNGTVTADISQTVAQPVESVHMNIELFIRVMEYAHENAKTDQELHQLTERAAAMSKDRILTMEDYEALVAELRRSPDDPNAAPQTPYPTMKTDPSVDSNKPTDIQTFGAGAL